MEKKNRLFYLGLYLAMVVALFLVFSGLLMLTTLAVDSIVPYTLTETEVALINYQHPSYSAHDCQYYVSSSIEPVYVVRYDKMRPDYTSGGTVYGFLFFSTAEFSVHWNLVSVNSGIMYSSYNSDYNVYAIYEHLQLKSDTSIQFYVDMPYFATEEEALSFASTYVPGGSTMSLSYDLPPGNIAYIPIPSGQPSQIPYTLTTTFYMAFGNNDLSRVNQVVTVSSSLPSGSSTQAPSSPPIAWVNNGTLNLFGISAHKIYNGTVSNSLGGYYLVVSNPMTMRSEGGPIGGDIYTNPSIHIEMPVVAGSPVIYPMSERLTILEGSGIDSESSYGDSGYTFEVDPDTGEIIWTAPDGSNSAPVAGGNNPMPTANTIFDWLRNISTQISDFLKGPVNAVQIVVGAIRDFMGSFTQLYQWLPSPVYSLITSALMIALTIGVIKIFV